MPSCINCGISQSKKNHENGITLHKFPKNETIKRKWIEFVGRENLNPNSQCTYLCSLHFSKDSFRHVGLKRARLKTSSIPSIRIKRIKNDRKQNPIIKLESENDETPLKKVESSSETPQTLSKDKSILILNKKLSKLDRLNKTLKLKLRRLQYQKCKREKRLKNLRITIKSLKKEAKHTNNDNQNSSQAKITEEFGGDSKLMNFLLGKKDQKSYYPEVRKFAITLHYLSPKAYQYVRSQFNNRLPHIKTLSKWYRVNREPGFSEEPSEILTVKSSENNIQIYDPLTTDEMENHQVLE